MKLTSVLIGFLFVLALPALGRGGFPGQMWHPKQTQKETTQTSCNRNRDMQMFFCSEDTGKTCTQPFTFKAWKESHWGCSPWANLDLDKNKRLAKPLTQEKAIAIVEFCIQWSEDPKLVTRKITKADKDYLVEIVNSDEKKLYELAIEIESGIVRLHDCGKVTKGN